MAKNIDLALVMDGTGSMHPIIGSFQATAFRLLDFFRKQSNEEINRLRVRVIVFGDYEFDMVPMQTTPFYDLGNEADKAEFVKAVDSFEAQGGGDIPENGLEALVYAFRSDFDEEAEPTIVMITDAPALALKERESSPSYPKDMPTYHEFVQQWNNGKDIKLYVIAPEYTAYQKLPMDLKNTKFYAVGAGFGLEGIDIEQIFAIVAKNV
mgnify:CR=1 FL=1